MPAPKLTPEQIADLRAKAQQAQPRGYWSAQARQFGVSRTSVSQIITGVRRAKPKGSGMTAKEAIRSRSTWARGDKKQLAHAIGVSPNYFYQVFAKLTAA